ncbi:MAG TPA: hypothetical protein VEK08_26140 [Planctomycetota bacterium]|nr:hypothetical protein [Planctomycetota bacterium]
MRTHLAGFTFIILVCAKSAFALNVASAAAEFEATDDMVIAGSIHAMKAKGQEGKLRAVATVLRNGNAKFAIVACDVLFITRQQLQPVLEEVEKIAGIPPAHVLVNATHTHHAPSTVRVHGYGPDERFIKTMQAGILKAIVEANSRLTNEECRFRFHLGREETVGQNSRMKLSDGMINWIGGESVRPTGPFDPELPVFVFADAADKVVSLFFNHSTHTIGTVSGSKRSPSFYGLAAQEIETDIGGHVTFLEGASGSTHNLSVSAAEAAKRIKAAVLAAMAKAKDRPVTRVASIKRPFKFKIRKFDEAKEEEAVTRYCLKNAGEYGKTVPPVFREMRKELAPLQGQERETVLQAMLIGDVAIVGVPAEYFTKLGLDIKNRSPFRYTYVAELANDWIGYLPDLDAHKLGGYQCWMGFHSYAEEGTGERVVDEIIDMLEALKK